MAHRKTERNPLFAGRWFEDDIILLCLRWYFRFKLSYRDLVGSIGRIAAVHSWSYRPDNPICTRTLWRDVL